VFQIQVQEPWVNVLAHMTAGALIPVCAVLLAVALARCTMVCRPTGEGDVEIEVLIGSPMQIRPMPKEKHIEATSPPIYDA
jgi:hypothetical protein